MAIRLYLVGIVTLAVVISLGTYKPVRAEQADQYYESRLLLKKQLQGRVLLMKSLKGFPRVPIKIIEEQIKQIDAELRSAGIKPIAAKSYQLIETAAPGAISGKVWDQKTTAPLAGVPVLIFNPEGRNDQKPLAQGVSDAQGNYKIAVEPGAYLAVASPSYPYAAEGFAGLDRLFPNQPVEFPCVQQTTCLSQLFVDGQIVVSDGFEAKDVNFALNLAGKIKGVLKAKGGKGIKNKGVYINAIYPTPYGNRAITVQIIETNRVGEYTSAYLPEGNYHVNTVTSFGEPEDIYADEAYNDVYSSVFGTSYLSNGDLIAVRFGETFVANFTLERGGLFTGRVTFEGIPISSDQVSIEIADSKNYWVGFGTTDSDGNIQLYTPLRAGKYHVVTHGFALAATELYDDSPFDSNQIFLRVYPPTGGKDVIVENESITTGIDIDLETGGNFSGLVTTASYGSPIRKAMIAVYDDKRNPILTMISGKDGTYSTEQQLDSRGLKPGNYFVKTRNTFLRIDEIYRDIPCEDQCDTNGNCNENCDPLTGRPVRIKPGRTKTGINFMLDIGM